MKHILHLFALLTIIAHAQTPAKRILLVNANVIDVKTGKVLSNTSLLIEGERIATIGKKVKAQKEDSVVDATGKYVIPGLWDMHTHVLGQTRTSFPLLLANGVTGIRNLHTSGKNPMQVLSVIRRRLKDNTLLGPRLVANGQLVDGEPVSHPASYVVRNAAEARVAVDSLIRSGGDFIKVYDHLSRDAYFAIAEECKKRNVPFEGHVPFSVTVEEAAKAGQKSIEHNYPLLNASTTIEKELTQEYMKAISSQKDSIWDIWVGHLLAAQDAGKRKALCRLLAAQQAWQCPTLIAYKVIFDSTVINDTLVKTYMPASTYKQTLNMVKVSAADPPDYWERWFKFMQLDYAMVKEMSEEGVPLLAGTDVGNPGLLYGFSLHDELGLFVKAGLSPLQALQTATLNPAKFFDWEKDLGTVEKGKYADLVLLDANPLTDIQNTKKIFAVVSNGRYLNRQRLDALLAE